VILFVGRVEKRKGADVLMNAIPRVHEISPDARFIFIGQVCEDVKEEIEKITSFAEFLGVRPRDEIVPWYQRASILVAPSLWDNSPNIIYEAMACGTPVVASRVGGIPELVDDGVTGLLVSPGDADRLAEAIVVLLGAGERREAMGSRARERALTEYAVDKILARTLKFYTRQTRTVENPSPEIKSQEL
jgi:starch synthase